ncbi:FAD-binding protein [Streptomyces sp. CHA1]|uniref:FAD-binding oxidoreductase n=1 Tax=Streptomyces TaxID=1883 RepID=UPI001BFCC685|nr:MULTISPECIES: FAD-binding protein [unclassified Streptomyces]MBT3160570.1 FAD-binding oxidoreductase [Streptomyces sp. G11C]MCO6704251.1 FAD-binding protein [Streptomyces sp. CHB9.2]MCO6710524.1 FAD-binding protein [Streptomyces sp. CHA3]MCO6716320.1 FAD-binding protein [Streptomyces sp. CHB19.2]MCO6722450.1 FAD-binding protein [Streptomyces sp. Vc714c-19]
MGTTTRTAWTRLSPQLAGDLVLPHDAVYEQAARLALGQYDHVRPAAVAYCETPEDVRTCLLFAREHGIHATPRSGGHGLAGWSTTEGLVIDLSRIAHVRIGPDSVHVGPGGQAVDAISALAPHGLQIAAGSDASVGLAGYLLGGGNGWQTRAFGLGSDRMVSAQVVLAEGRVLRCDSERHPELFWALRGGGGGNFGVVTDLEIRPNPVPRIVCYDVSWPWEQAVEVVEAWQQWMVHVPDRLASTLVALSLDAGTGEPPQLLVQGGYLGSPEEFERELAGLVAAVGRPPASAVSEDLPYRAAMMRQFGCAGWTTAQSHLVGHNPEASIPRHAFARDRSRMLAAPLTGSAVHEVLEVLEADSPRGFFRALTFRALGGAANIPAPEDTAYVHRDALFHAGYAAGFLSSGSPAETAAAAVSWVHRGFGVIDPHSNGHSYVNFPDPDLPDPHWSYYGSNYPRLCAVQRRYDPERFFRYPQSIGG